MEETIKKIEERIQILKKSLVDLQNNANAHVGAIQELERLKADLSIPVPVAEPIND